MKQEETLDLALTCFQETGKKAKPIKDRCKIIGDFVFICNDVITLGIYNIKHKELLGCR